MGKKNSAQIADKQTRVIELLLKVLFMRFLMDFYLLTLNFGVPLFRF
jgi:hypothetical protein